MFKNNKTNGSIAMAKVTKKYNELCSPAFFPPSKMNADVMRLNEQMNRYSNASSAMIFPTIRRIRFTFPREFNSNNYKKSKQVTKQ